MTRAFGEGVAENDKKVPAKSINKICCVTFSTLFTGGMPTAHVVDGGHTDCGSGVVTPQFPD